MSPSGIGGRDPISESEVGTGAWREVGRSNSTSTTVKAMGPGTGAGVGLGRRLARTAGGVRKERTSKGAVEEQFHE